MVIRIVIRERMDYKDHFGGNFKDELDGLERLEGKFVICWTQGVEEKTVTKEVGVSEAKIGNRHVDIFLWSNWCWVPVQLC